MNSSMHFILGIVIAFLWASSTGATPIYTQGFETDAPATEYASGDFDPATTQMGFGHFVTEFGVDNLVQVVDGSTNPNGNPSGGVQTLGTRSLKMDGNSGVGTPFIQLEPSGFDTPSVRSTTFSVYSQTGLTVGPGRLFEVWIDDTSAGGEPNVWGIRADENGDLYYDQGGWQLLGAAAVTHGQWNKFTIAADLSVGGSEVVNLWLNDVQLGGNIYMGTGDSLDQWQFQVNNAAGDGAGVFYDDIIIDDVFIPEPSTLLLCGVGIAVTGLIRRMRNA